MNRPFLKLLIALVVCAILIFNISGSFLKNSGSAKLAEEQLERGSLKIDHAIMTVSELNDRMVASGDHFIENLHKHAKLMANMLSHLIQDSKYTGPYDFEEGAVVRFENNQYEILGNRSPELYPALEPTYFEQDGSYIPSYLIRGNSDDGVLLVIQKIEGPYYYVDWTSYDELNEYFNTGGVNKLSLESLEEIYGDYIFITMNNSYFIYTSVLMPAADKVDISDLLGKENSVMTLRGNTYLCSAKYIEDLGGTVYLLSPYENIETTAKRWAFFFEFLSFIFVAAVLVWLCFIQKKAKDEVLSAEKRRQYNPSRVRFLIGIYALFGVLLIFATTYFIQMMNSLYTQTKQGDQILDVLISTTAQEKTQIQTNTNEEVEWYTYYAQNIAKLTQEHPELATKEVLSKVNEIMGSEYLIIFDEQGKQIAASNDYINYFINTEDKTTQTYDFRKLLMGVDYIVKDVENDELSARKVTMIGARTNRPNGTYGAVLIALNPDRLHESILTDGIDTRLQAMSYGKDLIFIAGQEDQIIKHATNPSLIGKDLASCGIDLKRLNDTMMDRFKLDGQRYYGLSRTHLEDICFYFVADTSLTGTSFYYCSDAAFSFLFIYLLGVVIMLVGYSKKEFEAKASEGFDPTLEYVFEGDNEIVHSSRSFVRSYWAEMSPEEKTQLVFEFLLSLLIISLLYFVNHGSGLIDDSLMSYILSGQYNRGINLFALTSTILLVIGSTLMMIVLRFTVSLLCMVLDSRGITICRLLFNLVEYVVVILVLYYSFGFLGFDNRGLLASVGFITLAVSLGSRDLVSDVLSGLTIVFEGEFKVGDMVEIGGFTGRVQDIGIRYTKLLGIGDNIKIVANREIRSVVNMTKMNSWYPIVLTIRTDQLDKTEQLLRENLPKIGEKIEEILSTPRYKGIEKIGSGTLSLMILAECRQQDYRRVSRLLNRELYDLCKKNDIELM